MSNACFGVLEHGNSTGVHQSENLSTALFFIAGEDEIFQRFNCM